MDWLSQHWNDLIAIGVIVTGIYWCVKKEVSVGWQGCEPSFYFKGRWAVFFGIVLIVVGTFLLFMNSDFMQVDHCLDSGGSYNHKQKICEHN